MPGKRYVKRTVTFLDREEIAALLAAPDRSTWVGRRDHVLLLVALQTGLRASELINLQCKDAVLGTGAHIRCDGKGRKERCTPLRRDTVSLLEQWLRERRGGDDQALFASMRGDRLSRDALQHLVRKHTLVASASCPSLKAKRVSPHILRHSTAMELLQHGVDQTVIALWLGHESVETTQIYIHADPATERKSPVPGICGKGKAWAISSRRQASRLPRSALIMPNRRMGRWPLSSRCSAHAA